MKHEECLSVFPRNDYEPDVVFFGSDKAATIARDTLKVPIPDLAVEVLSASTEKFDRGVQFEDFAASGVGEYWIVDPDAETVEHYVLENEWYQLRTKSPSGKVTSHVIEGLKIEITGLFDAQRNLAALRKIFG